MKMNTLPRLERKDAGDDDEPGEVKAALTELAGSMKAALDKIAGDVKEITARQDEIEKKANRPRSGGLDRPGGGDGADERKSMIEALGAFGRTGETKAMSAGTDPDGGYAMQPVLASAIRERAAQVSPIRAIANVVTLTDGDTWEEPVVTGLGDAEWAGEKAPRPETSTPPGGKTSIPTFDLYCNPPITQRLLDNSAYDVGNLLIRRIGKKFAQKEGAAFVNGNGVGKPRGFLAFAAAATTEDDTVRAWGKLQYVVSGSAASIADVDGQVDGLIDLVGKVQAEFLGNARWCMNRQTAAKCAKLKDADKNYIWQRSNQVGQPAMLLGYPVTLADDMPNEGAGEFPIAFGDFMEGYTIVDSAKMTILRDPYTNKPFVHFYTVERVGGDVRDFDAIKLLKCST